MGHIISVYQSVAFRPSPSRSSLPEELSTINSRIAGCIGTLIFWSPNTAIALAIASRRPIPPGDESPLGGFLDYAMQRRRRRPATVLICPMTHLALSGISFHLKYRPRRRCTVSRRSYDIPIRNFILEYHPRRRAEGRRHVREHPRQAIVVVSRGIHVSDQVAHVVSSSSAAPSPPSSASSYSTVVDALPPPQSSSPHRGWSQSHRGPSSPVMPPMPMRLRLSAVLLRAPRRRTTMTSSSMTSPTSSSPLRRRRIDPSSCGLPYHRPRRRRRRNCDCLRALRGRRVRLSGPTAIVMGALRADVVGTAEGNLLHGSIFEDRRRGGRHRNAVHRGLHPREGRLHEPVVVR